MLAPEIRTVLFGTMTSTIRIVSARHNSVYGRHCSGARLVRRSADGHPAPYRRTAVGVVGETEAGAETGPESRTDRRDRDRDGGCRRPRHVVDAAPRGRSRVHQDVAVPLHP